MHDDEFDDRKVMLSVQVRSDEGSVSDVVGDDEARDELIRFIADDDTQPSLRTAAR
jgi:hypothetical protein